MIKTKIFSIHLSLWVAYTVFAVIFYNPSEFLWSFYDTGVAMAQSAALFYANSLFALPRFFEKRRFKTFVCVEILLFTVSTSIRYFYKFFIDPAIFNDTPPFKIDDPKVFNLFCWQWFLYMLISTLYWKAMQSIRNERMARISAQKVAEQRYIELENAALRAQINPHFFVNTLNTFRIDCETVMPKLAKDLQALIVVLRSSISSTDDDGLTTLTKELEAVDSFYMLYKSRYPQMQVQYKADLEDVDDYRILPHVLVTIVENAFKHGEYMDQNKKMVIRIMLQRGTIEMRVYNWKCNRFSGRAKGISIPFLTRHLGTSYGDRHSLVIRDGEDDFEVLLKIEELDRVKNIKTKAA